MDMPEWQRIAEMMCGGVLPDELHKRISDVDELVKAGGESDYSHRDAALVSRQTIGAIIEQYRHEKVAAKA